MNDVKVSHWMIIVTVSAL